MTRLYRPTLHDLRVFHVPAAEQQAIAYVEAALEHIAAVVSVEDAGELREELEGRRDQTFARDLRYPLVRSRDFYPVRGCEPLTVAFFAYLEGVDLLVHIIWHLDDEADRQLFTELQRRVWSGPTDGLDRDLGQGLLLSAVVESGADTGVGLAERILTPYARPEGGLVELPLQLQPDGATLYVPARMPMREDPHVAVLLYTDREAEASPAADRFVTVEWPLLVLYQRRIDALYLGEYRDGLGDALRDAGTTLRRELAERFAPHPGRPAGAPALLAASNPSTAQQALAHLSGPQYRLLERLGEAERCAYEATVNLDNLRRLLRASPVLRPTGTPEGREGRDEVPASIPLLRRARQMVDQMETDIAAARLLAERAERAVDVIQTQADVLEATYERLLSFIIGVVGTALAVGEVVDPTTARVLYREWGLGVLWEAVGLAPLGPEDADEVLLGVRLLCMGIAMAIAWTLISLSVAGKQLTR